MKLSIFIVLTTLLAVSKGDHSEQSERPKFPGNFLPVTQSHPQSHDDEIAHLKRKISAISFLKSETLKNKNTKNEVSDSQKILHQPPSDFQNVLHHKEIFKNELFHYEKFSNYEPFHTDMIENFLHNYGIYIITAPLLFYPASLIIGTYGYMAFLLLIFIILKTFMWAMITLILT